MTNKMAEQLHIWYLEAITTLDGADYNHMADRPYEKLTEGQKFIDKYIANKLLAYLKSLVPKRKSSIDLVEMTTSPHDIDRKIANDVDSVRTGYNMALMDIERNIEGEG